MSVSEQFQQLETHVAGLIVGQEHLINRMLIALLCDGHMLVEGAPGLAKTRAIKVLAESIEGNFHRLQFTPDLLPADLTGTDIYRPQDGSFEFREGPLFHNLILADEINRAPAKVQSALLESMEERQITVGENTYKLPDLFMVMATRTRSSRRVRTRFPKLSSTASCSTYRSVTRHPKTSAESWC